MKPADLNWSIMGEAAQKQRAMRLGLAKRARNFDRRAAALPDGLRKRACQSLARKMRERIWDSHIQEQGENWRRTMQAAE